MCISNVRMEQAHERMIVHRYDCSRNILSHVRGTAIRRGNHVMLKCLFAAKATSCQHIKPCICISAIGLQMNARSCSIGRTSESTGMAGVSRLISSSLGKALDPRASRPLATWLACSRLAASLLAISALAKWPSCRSPATSLSPLQCRCHNEMRAAVNACRRPQGQAAPVAPLYAA